MLAYCLVEGLTCNRQVYRRGDIFVLPVAMESVFGDMTASQMAQKQKKMYRRELFRLPGDEEILDAYMNEKVQLSQLSPRQQNFVADKRGEDGARLQDAAKVLKEEVMKKNPDLAEEEGYNNPPPVTQVGSEETYVTENKSESAKKPSAAGKPQSRRTSTRRTKKE